METEIKEKLNAMIKSPSKDHHLRKGKGFSLSEIKAAGKTIQSIRKMNIPIDYFRKSTHKENVEKLKMLKFVEKKSKKKRPYVYKEKKRTPFKPKEEKVIKKKVKKAVPKKKQKPSIKEKEKVKPIGTPLTLLEGLGPATEKKLSELGVYTIEDLIKEDPKELGTLIRGVSQERIQNWIEEGKKLI